MKIYLLTLTLLLLTSLAKAGDCDFIQFNKCHSCNDPHIFNVGADEACAFLCPNRAVNYNVSGSSVTARNCALIDCPPEFPFRSDYGNCFAEKSEAENDYNTSQEENSNQDNIQEGKYSTAPMATDSKCPQQLPLLYSKKCFSCDEPDDLSISETECNKCPNRIYKVYPNWGVKHCEIACPAEKPLRRWDGTCFACDEPKVVRLGTHCNIEEDCENICPGRTILYYVGGNIPSIPNCPEDKPLMDSQGICYACDTPVAIGVEYNQSLCNRFCPNERHLEGVNCVLTNTPQKDPLLVR